MTNIDYIHHRTARRIVMMIAVVWLVAFLVCIAPLLGWKDPEWEKRVVIEKSCIVSQDIYYQVNWPIFNETTVTALLLSRVIGARFSGRKRKGATTARLMAARA